MATLGLTTRRDLQHSPTPNQSIPLFGFGTCQSKVCTPSALHALKSGYIHIDTAQIYKNETETGAALQQATSPPLAIPRSSLFICSKLWEDGYGRASALQGVKTSCEKLGLDYIDLYLLHTPRPGRELRHRSWLGLQDALSQGLVRTIGVSNWAPKHFEQLMKEEGVEVFPAVNQIEFHPWQQQRAIRAWCREKGVVVVAYSPLTQGKRLGEPVIVEIAERIGRTPAQVVLRWCLQRDVVVIPKSDKAERIEENMAVFGWELNDEDMARIDALDEGQAGNLGEWDPEAWD
jgi:diketogulonate reductase-like aldo/keto reductase